MNLKSIKLHERCQIQTHTYCVISLEKENYKNKNQISGCQGHGVREGNRIQRRNTRKFYKVMEMFYMLMVVMVPLLYTFVKTHNIADLNGWILSYINYILINFLFWLCWVFIEALGLSLGAVPGLLLLWSTGSRKRRLSSYGAQA